MKEVTAHHVGIHSKLKIYSIAYQNSSIPHLYKIPLYDNNGLPSLHGPDYIKFQVGNPNEVGFNGVTNEALLAIIRDRLIAFQSSKFACVENQQALVHVDEALEVLKRRTRDRITRKVEGTHIV
ncbi:MAG TPA: hypothetical protein VIR31_02565 [Nitrososphaeraceae archaeon]